MRIVAVTLKSFCENTERIAGGPGAEMWLEQGAPPGLLLVFLHPSANGRAWVDDQGQVVATAEQVSRSNLAGTVVFVGACFGVESKPLIEALKAAGASAIIAGPGLNFGGKRGVLAGADWLALGLRRFMQAGLPWWLAWSASRALLGKRAGADAMEYQVVYQADQRETRVQKAALSVAGALAVLWSVLQMMTSGIAPSPLTFFSSLPATGTTYPTAEPTWTRSPSVTHRPWINVPWPTATCAGPDCEPPAGAELVYRGYLPLAMRNHIDVAVFEWDKLIYVNGVLTETGATVSASDTITIADWVAVASSGNVTFTLVETWTASLGATGFVTSTGGVVTSSNALTWTAVNVGAYDYWAITKTWSVISGAWSTDIVTEYIAVEDGPSYGMTVTFVYSP